jgi:manganese transport protein
MNGSDARNATTELPRVRKSTGPAQSTQGGVEIDSGGHLSNATAASTLSGRTEAAIAEALSGRQRGWRLPLLFAGPAVVASIAYMDPGNFATNIQAGAKFGPLLLWVVVAANLIAMLFQALSAKLGIVTGLNLAELTRRELPRPMVIALWAVSEIAAMATDLAEFLGGAIGLSLIFNMPLMLGMAITAVVTYALLLLERFGFRPIELAIGALVAVICVCYLVELLIVPVAWGPVVWHSFVPTIPNSAALTIAVGIVGATVMPHALYLHSGLTQRRGTTDDPAAQAKLLLFSRIEVILALGTAGLVNLAMVIMASSAFHAGHPEVADIETAYHTLTPLLGGAAAGVFLTSLIASGISSSAVGTMAGQMIMAGFLEWRVPLWLRRLVTMLPAFAMVMAGANSTQSLVLSQVVLSLALPVPMILLVVFTSSARIMGKYRNPSYLAVLAALATAFVLGLNIVLLAQSLGVAVPGLS